MDWKITADSDMTDQMPEATMEAEQRQAHMVSWCPTA